MSEVKRYDEYTCGVHECHGYGEYVKSSDFDRVTAERDALQVRLNESDELCGSLERSMKNHRHELGLAQQRLTAAEEELDQCQSMALMIEEKEWAEHVGKGSISSRVESAFTQLQNELFEAHQGLTAADERLGQASIQSRANLDLAQKMANRLDESVVLLECVLDTGELTREKHLELEADICQLVTDFWGTRKAARIPSPPRCPDCGYTEQDCRDQMDHYLCRSPEPSPARK